MTTNAFITKASIARANNKYYRVAALFVGVGLILGYPVFKYFAPDMYDPLFLRLILAASFLGSYGASYISSFVERKFTLFFNGSLTLVLFWLLYLMDRNDFSFTATILFLIVSAINTTALGRSKYLPFYSLFILAITISYFSITGIDKGIGFTIILAILVVHFVIYLVIKSKEDTENSLKDSENRIKYLVHALGEGITIIDKKDIILFSNPVAEEIFETDSGRLTGQSVASFLSGKAKDQFSDRKKVNEDDAYNTFELRLNAPDAGGKTLLVTETAYILRQQRIEGSILVFRDISDRKNREKELLNAKIKAEESDRLKSAFLANMSHEIRTPMNSIIGFTELLNKLDLSKEVQKEYYSIITQSGNRLLAIINDIIDISKIEAGIIDIRTININLNEQVENIYSIFKPEAEAKGINISFRNGLPGAKAIIKTDQEKLMAIFTNLVKNAVKFTSEGHIEIGYKLNTTIESRMLEFYIKDTGIGIPVDRQQAVFDRFVQADIEDKKAFQGSGLGLAISKAYVELLGGSMWLESEEGNGSTFYFTLPYINVASEDTGIKGTEDKHESMTEIAKLKILVVEDDLLSKKLLEETLGKISSSLLFASNGLEAIEACMGNPDIDLILMDLKLPEMNGYEATKRIRAFNKNILIIAQSAFALTGDRDKALEAGCNEYIPKPIDTNELFALLRKHIQKEVDV